MDFRIDPNRVMVTVKSNIRNKFSSIAFLMFEVYLKVRFLRKIKKDTEARRTRVVGG